MEKTKTNLALSLKKRIFNLKNLINIIFLSALILGISYIAGTNDLSIKGFTLNELKLERNRLADENNKLEISAMTLSSYGAISQKVNNLKMVAVGNVDYISINNSAMAKK